MSILKTIENRKSIRAYLDKPVEKDMVNEILEKALRSPSATNIQPWNIYVASGNVLDNIKREYLNRFLSGAAPTIEEPPLADEFKARRVDLAKDLFALLDIKREDKDKRKAWVARGFKYFDAPVALIFTVKKDIYESTWSILAIGSLIQTIGLVAHEYGLGTCISEQGVSYHDVLQDNLHITDDENIVISMTLGYADEEFPCNKLVSRREAVEDVTHWFGFE